jgi:hypothetical protein
MCDLPPGGEERDEERGRRQSSKRTLCSTVGAMVGGLRSTYVCCTVERGGPDGADDRTRGPRASTPLNRHLGLWRVAAAGSGRTNERSSLVRDYGGILCSG